MVLNIITFYVDPAPDVLRCCVPAHEDGQEGDAGGGDPGQDDHHDSRPHRDGASVHQRPRYGVISATETKQR